jgi:hypothetical protein
MSDATLLAAHDLDALPAEAALPEDGAESTLALVEMLLKDPGRLRRLAHDPARQRDLVPRFLLIAIVGYLIFSGMMVLLLNLATAAKLPAAGPLAVPPAQWSDGSAIALPIAYTLSIVLASCVCLPSFYFYSLLAGVRLTWLQIVAVVLKGTAFNAVILLGLVPIYLAVMLGMIVFGAPPEALGWSLVLGLMLPFVAGLWGLRSIYLGIADLAAAMPVEWRCQRTCLLRRLTLSWAAVYSAVLPVMIYRLWEWIAAAVGSMG